MHPYSCMRARRNHGLPNGWAGVTLSLVCLSVSVALPPLVLVFLLSLACRRRNPSDESALIVDRQAWTPPWHAKPWGLEPARGIRHASPPRRFHWCWGFVRPSPTWHPSGAAAAQNSCYAYGEIARIAVYLSSETEHRGV